MSFKATRRGDAAVEPFDWGPGSTRPRRGDHSGLVPPQPGPEDVDARLAALEREAFTKGYAQGERAGAEAAATRGEAMLRRLAETLQELAALRAEMIHKTERQLVQLALAIAGRILHREISLDRELLVTMARVALDRLGDTASATIRLNPEDYAATAGAREGASEHKSVKIVADPLVRPGGCLVQSDFGLIDISVDAQLTELTAALLGNGQMASLREAQNRVESTDR